MDSSEYSAGRNSPNQLNQQPPLNIYGPSPSPLTGPPSYKPRLLQTAPLIYDSSTSPLRVEENTPKTKKQPSGIGKHHPPYPTSEVWRLERIHENSLEALRLAEDEIHTVKDLRRSIAMNPNALRQILGRLVSEKVLDTIVSHAMQCVLDEAEYYIFHAETQGAFLLFNSVYELRKVSLDGVTSVNYDQLSSNQKALLEDLKRQAYGNIKDFVAVDGWALLDRSLEPLSCLHDAGCSNEFEDQKPGSPRYSSESFFVGFDVFFTYRRGDICSEFISHLRAALCRRGIRVYDHKFDEVPTNVQSEIAVPKCRVLIIFLTRNYVPSNLADIIEQRRTKDHVVFPVFYGLTPSDLICKIESYTRFFLCEKTKLWWAALKELAQMSGYILADKTESELIEEIVIYISKVLCSNNNTGNMFGMDVQVEEILSLLCIESPDVRSLGIWGMVGIGKTTIAEEIFRRISVQYETCIFLKDLHEEIELKGHDAVEEELLSRVLDIEPHVLRISGIKTSFLRSRLQRKKVLIILDDVNDYRDVETFLGKLNYIGPGSRLIVTSRNRRVFLLCKIDHVYEVKPLDIPNSLQLLDRGTCQSVLSPEVYRTLSLEVVKYSNGNPQVLQFLSSIDREWIRLSQEQKTSPICIPGVFERSCCGLDENERSIFLDIACFFRRMDKDNVAMLLDGCGFSTHVGFRSLVDKTLLTISQHNMVDMLNFIQATGREIVRQESADRPGDRSRLWNTEDIRAVFIDDNGTPAIEGIFLDMANLKFDASPNVFEKMYNLRLLKVCSSKVEKKHGISFPQGLEYLPSKLRLLHWEYYPLSSLPKSFNPENVVELNLPCSCAKKLWKGKKSLEKLKRMRLSYSYQLTKIPTLSSAPNLELLDLEGCNSLLSISQSISYLKKLVILNLKDCSKLESIPSMLSLESLEVLNLSGCTELENFPEISPNVKEIYMGGTMIQEIPSSIKKLVLLEKLDLENSRHLKNLPTSIGKLKHLETLNLSGCSSLERFPDLSRRMKCLRFLDLSRTAIKELPSSISYLTALEELRFVDCKSFVKLPIVTIPNANFTELMPSESNKIENLGTERKRGPNEDLSVSTSSLGRRGKSPVGRLEQRDAAKHINYDAAEDLSVLKTCSLEYSDRTSFRVGGGEREIDPIFRSLAISFDAWEACKKRSSSLSLKLDNYELAQDLSEAGPSIVVDSNSMNRDITELTRSYSRDIEKFTELMPPVSNKIENFGTLADNEVVVGGTVENRRGMERTPTILVKSRGYLLPNDVVAVGGGFKGIRPPIFKLPLARKPPPILVGSSSWDFHTHFNPSESVSSSASENGCGEEEVKEENVETEETGAMSIHLGDLEACSFTINEGDSRTVSTTSSSIYASEVPSITSWQKGQLLGRGSFGSVYEGISGDGDFFAVKEVSLLDQGSQAQDCVQQLEREVALLSQLQHQNIVRYRGTAKDESNLYIFLELITQGSLQNLYQRYQLRDSVVSLYTRQILYGLKYIHDRGVIHRDIKCANVLVDASGAVKLADFGLAKVLNIKSHRGTPFWMAPEVINPNHNYGYGSPADIWSLGCTVLEMLTGQIPYSDLEPVQALFGIRRGRLPKIPDTLSPDARHFILKCLKVNPEERPTAAELLNHPFVRMPSLSRG